MIRLWEVRDSIRLIRLLASFIESQNKLGAQLVLCEENVLWYLQMGLSWASKGQPTLLWEEDQEILSFLQMGECLYPLRLQEKTYEILTAYTAPKARSRFLNVELFRAAGVMATKQGCKRVYSTVFTNNEKMLQNMFFNPAIWPTRLTLEWNLKDDPQFVNGEIENFVERKIA